MSEYSLADVAAATGNDANFACGANSWVLIILFAMIFGWGNGGFGSNGGGDLQRAIGLNSIQDGQAGISADIQRTNYEQIAITKDAQIQQMTQVNALAEAVNAGFANQQSCCCEVKGAIMENRYLAAQTANENTQKILDALATNRMADMQNQINQLQLQNAVTGVVRYPMSTTYNSGGNPFCGCGSGMI